jgi:hypothetical protein
VEGKRVALDMVLHVQDDHPERLKKRLVFTSKWSTTWHYGVGDASLTIHLQSFHCPHTTEEEWPSLETPA